MEMPRMIGKTPKEMIDKIENERRLVDDQCVAYRVGVVIGVGRHDVVSSSAQCERDGLDIFGAGDEHRQCFALFCLIPEE